jgi:Protein of unknown function DUF262
VATRKRRDTDEEDILDINEAAEVIPYNYAITAYGADYPVDGLVQRLQAGNIVVPLFSGSVKEKSDIVKFQREYVWTKLQANRFIESLLLGLPVPGIFLVKELDGLMLVLDGHQRLRTLHAFYENHWNGEEFKLDDIQDRFKGLGYADLEPEDRRRIDDSIIHATIVRQDEPSDDQSSIYLIFERLNSGGTSLQPQEIRVALYHGEFVGVLTALNQNADWRALYGKKSRRLKDIELILRFFAFYYHSPQYKRPMKGFLNAYMAKNKHLKKQSARVLTSLFENTVEAILHSIGPKAFKPQASLNAAVFDSVMIGIARRLESEGPIASPRSLATAYRRLIKNKRYQAASSRATADEESVRARLELATKAFSKVA